MALGLIGSFLVNTALSIGFNLIGSWLSPSKGNQVAEDVPGLGAGSPLYYVFGSSFCPCLLLYAVPASKIGASEDTSSYGVLSLANPDSTCSLLAIRANNLLVSSSTPLFNLNAPSNAIPNSSKYTNKYGMRTYSNFDFDAQLNVPVYNPDFTTLGYGGLQYTGLGWVRVIKAERKLFGGFNSRLTVYYKNKITNTVNQSYSSSNDNPITIQTTFATPGKFTTVWYDIPFSYPHGFYGARVFRCFEGGGQYNVIGIGGGEDYVIYENIPHYTGVYFKVLTNVIPGGTSTTQGQFSSNTGTLDQLDQGMSKTVIVGVKGQKIYQIDLPALHPTPFHSNNGNIFDRDNILITTVPQGTKVYGWAGKMFVHMPDDPFFPIDGGNLIGDNPAISGDYLESFTNLSTILTDLLVAKGIPLSRIIFTASYTESLVRGYTDTTENVTEKIINLCTAYAKIVDDGFDGVYKFSDYPSDRVIAHKYTYADLFEDPEIIFTPKINQPDQVELNYRNWESEYSEKIVTVGYGASFPNQKSMRLNLVLTEPEAKKLAWNILFLTSHTNMSVRIHVDSINNVVAGSVITLQNPGTAPLKLLVANIEIGADRTYLINCVNYVPLYSLLSTSTPTLNYTSYMLGNSRGQTTASSQIAPVTPFLISAEPTTYDYTTTLGGTLFYTSDSAQYAAYADNGDLTPTVSKIPVAAGFVGVMVDVSSSWGDGSLGGITVVINASPTNTATITSNGLIRIGASWCRYKGFTIDSSIVTLTGVEIGLYGSENLIGIGDRVVQVSTDNTVKGHVASLTQFKPAYVQQSQSNFSLYGQPPNSQYPSGINIGQVTPQYPYGYPASGIVPAKLMSSYYAGLLKVWFSVSGNQPPSGFLFDSNTSSNAPAYTSYWVKPIVGAAIYLGDSLSGYREFNVVLPKGQYTVYQQSSGEINLPAGSYSWVGYAL